MPTPYLRSFPMCPNETASVGTDLLCNNYHSFRMRIAFGRGTGKPIIRPDVAEPPMKTAVHVHVDRVN